MIFYKVLISCVLLVFLSQAQGYSQSQSGDSDPHFFPKIGQIDLVEIKPKRPYDGFDFKMRLVGGLGQGLATLNVLDDPNYTKNPISYGGSFQTVFGVGTSAGIGLELRYNQFVSMNHKNPNLSVDYKAWQMGFLFEFYVNYWAYFIVATGISLDASRYGSQTNGDHRVGLGFYFSTGVGFDIYLTPRLFIPLQFRIDTVVVSDPLGELDKDGDRAAAVLFSGQISLGIGLKF